MSSVIVEKHANLLSMEDVIYLFERLEETVGNKVQAAKICGLERKTTYGWKKTREIRLKTKKKILAALIENLTEETLDFIVQRSAEASTDVLRIYLSALYEKAMSEKLSVSEFLHLASKFDQTKQKYSGLIAEHLEIEVGDMLRNYVERAQELGISFKSSPFNLVKLTEFSLLIPSLIKTISTIGSYTPNDEIAEIFNIPEEFVQTISTALYDNYVVPTRAIEPIQTVEPSLLAINDLEIMASGPTEPIFEFYGNYIEDEERSINIIELTDDTHTLSLREEKKTVTSDTSQPGETPIEVVVAQ